MYVYFYCSQFLNQYYHLQCSVTDHKCHYPSIHQSWQSCFMIGSFHLQNYKIQWKIPLWHSGQGDTGSIPGPGRSHMLQSNEATEDKYWACMLELPGRNYQAHKLKLLSLSAPSPEAHAPVSLCPTARGARTVRSPYTATPRAKARESLCKATKTQSSQN